MDTLPAGRVAACGSYVVMLSEQEHLEIASHRGLTQVLAWAVTKPKTDVHPQIVAEVITQDEFTHDVIVPYRDVLLVYDTT